jgi:hypothetical protein
MNNNSNNSNNSSNSVLINPMKILSVNDKISHILDYDRGVVVEDVRLNKNDVEVSRFFCDRYNKRHEFLDSQIEIIKRIINPHSVYYSGIRYINFEIDRNLTFRQTLMKTEEINTYLKSMSDKQLLKLPVGKSIIGNNYPIQCMDGNVTYEGLYPVYKILNLSTGCGKTCITVKGMLQCIQSIHTQNKLFSDYASYIRQCAVKMNGHHEQNELKIREKSIFLPNVILVHVPHHLVGVWRDTFRANGNDNVEVFPKLDTLIIRGFDHEEALRNSNKTYVIVVNHNSIKRFIKNDSINKEYTYGAIIIDEVETNDISMHGSHQYLPLAMYNLLVTATPHGINDSLLSTRNNHYYLARLFKDDDLSSSVCANIFSTYHNFIPSNFTNDIVSAHANYMARLSGMHIIQRNLFAALVQEIQLKIPKMHSYTLNCTASLSRLLGLVTSDMQNAANEIEKEEERLGVRFRGNSIQEIVRQIDERVAQLERFVKYEEDRNITPSHANKMKIDRLRFVRNKISTELPNECGICLDENHNKVYLTTCCAFGICQDCMCNLTTRRCPMCRCESINYAVFNAAPQETTTNAVIAVEEYPRVVKNIDGFESWLSTNQFGRTTQSITCDIILKKAYEYGLTHVIVAGGNVSKWNILKNDIKKLYAFDIVRPGDVYEVNNNRKDNDVDNDNDNDEEPQRKKPRSVGRVDKVYKKFCSASETPQLLLLDMYADHSAQVSGIDAKFTDLIIQVDTFESAGGDAPSNIQLAGRALRLGRNVSDRPIRVVLSI